MIPDPEERPVMSVREAAAALGVSRSKAYALVADGTWPSLRWGRFVVIPTAALRRLLDLPTTEAEGTSTD